MTSRFLTAIFLLASTCSLFAQECRKAAAHVGLVYPLSTNGANAAEYTNGFSLHAIAGVSRRETSFCASGIASIIKDSASGFVASGVANIIGKDATGAQFAGIVNYTHNHVKGVAAAGVVNIMSSVDGAAVAGFINVTDSSVKGAAIAGFINITGTVTGASVAGFANITIGNTNGAQVAGFINSTVTTNTQIAGFANVATEVKGPQVAGFINIAKKVRGPQIAGFLNIADSSDCPIGLVNIVKNGEKAIGLTVDETGTAIAAFRSGGRIMYGIVGIGFNPVYNSDVYAMQAGLGAHIPLSHAFRFNIEASTTSLHDFKGNSNLRAGLRVLPAIRLGAAEIFAGPSFNFTTTPDAMSTNTTFGNVWRDHSYCRIHELSVGIEGGIQFHLEHSRKEQNKAL